MANRKSAADRRDEILRATLRLVGQKGFATVTLRDVATEVGVSHGLVHHYFPERDHLVAESFHLAAAEEYERWQEEFSSERAPLDRLAEFCQPPEREHYLIWIDAWSEAPRNAALRASLQRHHREWEGVLRRAIEDGVVTAGLVCPDPVTSAHSILAHFDGLAVQCFALDLIDERDYQQLGLAHVAHHIGLAATDLLLRKPAL